MLRPYIRHDAAQFRYVRPDFDVELAEQFLAHSPTGDPSHGLTGAGALKDVAGVQAVVLEGAGEICVSRPRPGDLAPATLGIGRRIGFRGHDILPVLPVAVPDEHGDRGAQRFAGP